MSGIRAKRPECRSFRARRSKKLRGLSKMAIAARLELKLQRW
jgi:hypothetical protein